MITSVVVYIHGKDGSATESEHYKLLFPDCDVIGLDYQTFSPWETGQEIRIAVEELKSKYENVSLIANMMKWANVTEQELESKGIVHTDFGEDLSWKYLCYVKSHPIEWRVPTQILYGSNDHLTSIDTITDFANKHQATLTIMKNGEHWFHTEDQMLFLDNWIKDMK